MKQTNTFNIEVTNNVVTNIGKSTITQPPTKFTGGAVKWFDDSKLMKKKE